MKYTDFNLIAADQMYECLSLLTAKSAEYNKSQADRLDCFKRAASLLEVTSKQALAGMMVKHTDSIYQMIMTNKEYTLEKWEEKITDHINYLLLLKALLIEETYQGEEENYKKLLAKYLEATVNSNEKLADLINQLVEDNNE